jgi:hypothetical protein
LERLIPRLTKAPTEKEKLGLYAALRLVAGFALSDSPIDAILDRGVDLWTKVRQLDPIPLLQAINRYFAFGLIELGDDLELWLQHDTERRLAKPDVQVSLGMAPASDFIVRHSNVVANRPAGCEQISGGRLLLSYKNHATLTITKDLVDGIVKGRSHRMNERRSVEYDWRLARYFEQIAANISRPERLKAARYDFQARTGQLMVWQVTSDKVRKVAA